MTVKTFNRKYHEQLVSIQDYHGIEMLYSVVNELDAWFLAIDGTVVTWSHSLMTIVKFAEYFANERFFQEIA